LPNLLGLIPYFPQPRLDLGWISFEAWGVLVAVAFLSGVFLAMRAARKMGLDDRVIADYGLWAFVGGFTGAHLVHVLFYEPHLLVERWWFIFVIWSGMSSYGGFLGAAVATVIFFRRRAESFWHYADALAMGMAPAWAIARVGCFLAHDHRGSLSDFPLAVAFPGGARHDLGLYDAILSFAITAVIYALFPKRPRFGVMTGIVCGVYAFVRFFFDYLRATDIANPDARYLGLTPAQYGSVVLCAFGVYMVVRSRRMPRPGEVGPQGQPLPAGEAGAA
jgi:phosphatidylglycerol:prolipoprotein diacylglycerol transferase